jgi:hypothetical protein
MPPCASGKARQAHVADTNAHEASDGMADREHHAAHLAVAAFVNREFHLSSPLPRHAGLGTVGMDDLHVFSRGSHPVFQPNAAG